ncbi:peptidoglycan recognition protein family protein [Streptomyces hydrogenans]|uniref:peptidoglycan recognition protein family protein n=1 Tax=Streptomyces hydrogenans TaxID=1873719 RepID=UPI0037F78600
MARTGPQRIPGAVFDLYFGDGRYSGSDMEVNCGVIHTTEGPTLYDYQGGASAPTVTSVPDFKNKRLVHHQHFDVDESARALVNEPGGVQTNTANAFQWELVGTCDPATHAKWTRQGIEHIYWPEPPDWAVRDVAALMRWLNEQHGIPLTGRPEWMAYPASYGDTRVRMSNAEWTAFKGWCGHQHVPENDHGDPGALPFARILAVAKGGTIPEEDDMTPEERKLLTDTAAAVKRIEAALDRKPWTYIGPGDPRDMHQVVKDIDTTVRITGTTGMSPEQIKALVKEITPRLAADLAARLAN